MLIQVFQMTVLFMTIIAFVGAILSAIFQLEDSMNGIIILPNHSMPAP